MFPNSSITVFTCTPAAAAAADDDDDADVFVVGPLQGVTQSTLVCLLMTQEGNDGE